MKTSEKTERAYNTNFKLEILTTKNIAGSYKKSKESKMKELTIKELKLISDGVGPAGAVGGAVAAVTYTGYSIGTGQGSPAGLAGAAVGGAAAGFFTGPASFPGIIAGAEVGFHGGLIGGGIERIIGGQNPPVDPAGLSYCGGGLLKLYH